jgi:predicted metal-dependent hydrolase
MSELSVSPATLRFLLGYPPDLIRQVAELLARGGLDERLQARYPEAHQVRSDGALYDYVCALKAEYMRKADPISRVAYDGKLQTLHQALGTHTNAIRVQGGRLRSKREIRVATLFRQAPEAFLRMIVVHELAHLREKEHDKPFYQLCCWMEPDYHRLELDLRIYLCWLEHGGAALWA